MYKRQKYGKLLFDNEHLIEVGVLDRVNDAIIPCVGFGINNLKFGISYDVVTNKSYTIYNAQSTGELSFVWNWK